MNDVTTLLKPSLRKNLPLGRVFPSPPRRFPRPCDRPGRGGGSHGTYKFTPEQWVFRFWWGSAVVFGNTICALWCRCIDCIAGSAVIHVSCRSLSFHAISAMNAEHADTYPAQVVGPLKSPPMRGGASLWEIPGTFPRGGRGYCHTQVGGSQGGWVVVEGGGERTGAWARTGVK